MPKAVVYDLEVVYIHEQYRDPAVPPIGTSRGVFEAFHEQHPVWQSGKRIVERLMVQLPLDGFSPGDVLEGYHRADHLAVLEYRGAHVLDRKARAVLPPEDLVIPTVGGSILERRVDWTLFTRIGGAVRFRMVEDVMLGTAYKVFGLPPRYACRGRIDERGVPVQVQSEDPFASRLQDHLVLAAKPLECLLECLTLGDFEHEP